MTPYVCPVCRGNGLVDNGFYNQTSGQWSSVVTTPEKCRTCNGSGVVWGPGDTDANISKPAAAKKHASKPKTKKPRVLLLPWPEAVKAAKRRGPIHLSNRKITNFGSVKSPAGYCQMKQQPMSYKQIRRKACAWLSQKDGVRVPCKHFQLFPHHPAWGMWKDLKRQFDVVGK